MVNPFKNILDTKTRVLILGYGKEGRSSFATLRALYPKLIVGIADGDISLKDDTTLKNADNIQLHVGEKYLLALNDYDVIIKSPGVKLPNLDKSIFRKVTSQTDLFLGVFSSQTIGVTGTKGKSTTASLINHILQKCGKKSILIGNIGVPAFEMLNNITSDTIVVYELSAHQLEYVHRSPHIAVLLNIFPEHLDYFDDEVGYQNAKHNIYKFQNSNDKLIIGSQVKNDLKNINGELFCIDNSNIDLELAYPLLGNHNKLNSEIAISAVLDMGVNRNDAVAALKSFIGLPHRLEVIGKHGGITFINDSISTIPESTIAAMESMNGDVDILILGGYDRGLDYAKLCEFLENSEVRVLILTGDAGHRMKKAMPEKLLSKLYFAQDMGQVFDVIIEHGIDDDVCLLSPAAASYDQFKNFEHRGDGFRELAGKFKFE